jgi:uncharacterized membrane-anchored protein
MYMVVRVAMVGLIVSLIGAADAGPARPEPLPSHITGITGPKLIDLGNHTQIDLPAGMILFERAEAQRLLRKAGEPADDVVAIVRRPDAEWSVILSYSGTGYVNDSDPSTLDAGELLAAYRAVNQAQNERRRAHGTPELALVPALVIDGWAEPPHYDRTQHHLVWGVAAHKAGGALVNHFTRILGRDGFLSVNLIDGAETMARSRQEVRSIVQATRFQPGSRYEDHTPGDGSSGAGLASLVLSESRSDVAVAAKLGLLAQIVLVFKPEIVVVLLGMGGLFRRWFRRRSRGTEMVELAAADTVDATGALW